MTTPKTLYLSDLIEDLSLHHDVGTKVAAKRIMEFILDYISTNVAAGNTVSITRFGTFRPFKRYTGGLTPKFYAFKQFNDIVATPR